MTAEAPEVQPRSQLTGDIFSTGHVFRWFPVERAAISLLFQKARAVLCGNVTNIWGLFYKGLAGLRAEETAQTCIIRRHYLRTFRVRNTLKHLGFFFMNPAPHIFLNERRSCIVIGKEVALASYTQAASALCRKLTKHFSL